MTKHTSQDHDRKHQHDHTQSNPRAAKELPNPEDSGSRRISPETAELIAEGHVITNTPPSQKPFLNDKRKEARQEHTNHFTNRAPGTN